MQNRTPAIASATTVVLGAVLLVGVVVRRPALTDLLPMPARATVEAILLIASRWWQIDSLYRFNDKFHPEWQPRFSPYSRARDLPRIALAALEAEAFVASPRSLDRLVGRAR